MTSVPCNTVDCTAVTYIVVHETWAELPWLQVGAAAVIMFLVHRLWAELPWLQVGAAAVIMFVVHGLWAELPWLQVDAAVIRSVVHGTRVVSQCWCQQGSVLSAQYQQLVDWRKVDAPLFL